MAAGGDQPMDITASEGIIYEQDRKKFKPLRAIRKMFRGKKKSKNLFSMSTGSIVTRLQDEIDAEEIPASSVGLRHSLSHESVFAPEGMMSSATEPGGLRHALSHDAIGFVSVPTNNLKEPTEQNGASSMSLGSDANTTAVNTDFDMDIIPTTSARLNNKAAYDKIAIRPKDRKAARKARGISQIVHADTHVNGFGGLSPTATEREDESGSRESSPKAKRSRPPSVEPIDTGLQPTSDRAVTIQKRLSLGRSPLGPGPGMPVSLSDVQGMQGKLRKTNQVGEGYKGRTSRAMTDSMAMKSGQRPDSSKFSLSFKNSNADKVTKSDTNTSSKNTYLSRKFGLSMPMKPTASTRPSEASAGAVSEPKKSSADAIPLRKFVEAPSPKSVTSPLSQQDKGTSLISPVTKMDTGDEDAAPGKKPENVSLRAITSPMSPEANKAESTEATKTTKKKTEGKGLLLSEFGKPATRSKTTPVTSPASPPAKDKKESNIKKDAPVHTRKFGKASATRTAPIAVPALTKTDKSDAHNKPNIPKGKPIKESKVSAAAKFFSGAGNNDRARKKSVEKSQGAVNHSENNSKGHITDLKPGSPVMEAEEDEKNKALNETNVDKSAARDVPERKVSESEEPAAEKDTKKTPPADDQNQTPNSKANEAELSTKSEPEEATSASTKLRSPSNAVSKSISADHLRKTSESKDKKSEKKHRKSKDSAPIPTYRLLAPEAPAHDVDDVKKREEKPDKPDPNSSASAPTREKLAPNEANGKSDGVRERTVSSSGSERAKSSDEVAASVTIVPQTEAEIGVNDTPKPEASEEAPRATNEKLPSRVSPIATKPLTGPMYSRAKLRPIAKESAPSAGFEGRRNMSLKVNTTSQSRAQRSRSFNVADSPKMAPRATPEKQPTEDKEPSKTGANASQVAKASAEKSEAPVNLQSPPKAKPDRQDEGLIQDVQNNNVKPFPEVATRKTTPDEVSREVTPSPQPRKNSRTTPTETKTARADTGETKDGSSAPSWVQLARRRSKVWEDSGLKSLRAAPPRSSPTVNTSSKDNDRPKSLPVSSPQPTSAIKSRENTPKASTDVPPKPAQERSTEHSPIKRASPLTPSSKVSLNRKPQTQDSNVTNPRRFTASHATKDPSSAQPSWLAIAMQKQKRWTKEEAV